jgi:nucleotide-binding universal stress UspA family protein
MVIVCADWCGACAAFLKSGSTSARDGDLGQMRGWKFLSRTVDGYQYPQRGCWHLGAHPDPGFEWIHRLEMTMKDILVHVRDFEKRTQAAYFGVRLAATLGATVTGVYACPRPLYIAPAYEPELMTESIQAAREWVKNAVQSKQSFLDWAASLGVPQAEWLVAEGPAGDALAQAATRHDLLILDHPEGGEGSAWEIPGVILKTDIPCIVLPHHGVHYSPFERIAIGWNGSPEAMRAVHAALPFLQGKQALLLWGEERDLYHGVDWDPPFNIMDYLRDHGVSAEQHFVTGKHDDVGGVLLEEAMKFGAQLFVMGAYGRSRFSEWMLGGATRHVLTWADIPVFLRH